MFLHIEQKIEFRTIDIVSAKEEDNSGLTYWTVETLLFVSTLPWTGSTGRTTTLAPFVQASFTRTRARRRFVCLSAVVASCINARRRGRKAAGMRLVMVGADPHNPELKQYTCLRLDNKNRSSYSIYALLAAICRYTQEASELERIVLELYLIRLNSLCCGYGICELATHETDKG